MKIKDIKGIVSKLPEKENIDYFGIKGQPTPEPYAGQIIQYNMAIDRVLNTDIDINDIVELDVEWLENHLLEWYRNGASIEAQAQAICEAKPFKEKER